MMVAWMSMAVSVVALVVTFGRRHQGERVASILVGDLRRALSRKRRVSP